MAFDVPPPYLRGTFDWLSRGYHLAATPEIDLRSETALYSQNPWIVVAAVVERAKIGDHSAVGEMARFLRQPQPFALDRVSTLVVGDAGTNSHLQLLLPLLK